MELEKAYKRIAELEAMLQMDADSRDVSDFT